MTKIPESVATFLAGKRFAVAGVSRDARQSANAIFRKLRASGYDAVPVNPHADTLEGVTCYPDLSSIPGDLDGVVVATHPDAALDVVRQAAARGIRQLWFHRSFGSGSVSDVAIAEARSLGLACIVGGCPLMFCEPVDVFHRCARGMLAWRGRLPD